MSTNIIFFFVMLFVLLFLGIPVVYSIGLDSALYMLIFHVGDLIQIPTKIYAQNDSYVLLAIPLFVFCGMIMEAGGISRRLVDFIYHVVGRQPGALGTVAVLTCMVFAALTGSAVATTVAIGSIMVPMMVEHGYDPKFAAGLVCSAGALGPIIPPSVPMVIYGSAMNVSVADLFLGGVIPGILMGLSFIVINLVYAIRHKVPRSTEPFNMKETLKAFWKSLGVLFLPVIILGGIYSGKFTPTEAGTIAAIYALALTIFYRQMTVKKFLELCRKTVSSAGSIMCIICVSGAFAYILTIEQIPQKIATMLLPYMSSQAMFMVIMFLFLLVVGAVMDSGPGIMILAPIISPIGVALGLSPVYVGVMFCCIFCMGAITPPFGVTLFAVTPIAKIPFAEVSKGAARFIIAAFAVLLVLCFLPDVVMLFF